MWPPPLATRAAKCLRRTSTLGCYRAEHAATLVIPPSLQQRHFFWLARSFFCKGKGWGSLSLSTGREAGSSVQATLLVRMVSLSVSLPHHSQRRTGSALLTVHMPALASQVQRNFRSRQGLDRTLSPPQSEKQDWTFSAVQRCLTDLVIDSQTPSNTASLSMCWHGTYMADWSRSVSTRPATCWMTAGESLNFPNLHSFSAHMAWSSGVSSEQPIDARDCLECRLQC